MAIAAFVAPLHRNMNVRISSAVTLHQQRQPNEENDKNILISVVDRVTKILSQPTAFSLPLGYPVTLVASFFLLPFPAALLLSGFFGGFSYLGRQLLDDEDVGAVNLASLLASIASAGLVAPFDLQDSDSISVVLVLGLAGALLTSAVRGEQEDAQELEEQLFEEQRLQDWDEQLRRETQAQDDENKF